MRNLWVLVCLLVPLGGCIDQPSSGRSPLVGPPKLVVDRLPDNRTQVFVHASVGEVNYTHVRMRLDNATRGEPGFRQSNHTYAFVAKFDATRFHLNVTVDDGTKIYGHEAAFRFNLTVEPGTTVVASEDDRRSVELPFTTTLDVRRET